MAITLSQAQQLSNSKLTKFVIDEFRKSALLEQIPFEVSEAEYTPARFSHWARGKTQNVRIVYNYLDDINAKLNVE